MEKCRYCGREAAPEFRFCPFCGGALTAEKEADLFLLQKPVQGQEVLYRSWEEVCAVTGKDPAKLLRKMEKQADIPSSDPTGESGKPGEAAGGEAEGGKVAGGEAAGGKAAGGEAPAGGKEAGGTGRKLVPVSEAFPGDNVKIGGVPWKVLWVRGARKLLLSQQSVVVKAFSESGAAGWEGSSLRHWLNRQYLESSFTKEEQDKILPTEYLTRISEQEKRPGAFGRRKPERTTDRVGILSSKEFGFYVSQLSEEARKTFFSYESPGFIRDIYLDRGGKASVSVLCRMDKGEQWSAAEVQSVSNVYPVIWYCV